MRHGLDFVDLQNPKVRRPTVRLEQRIMIGTEMSRCALTMNGGVEHAAEAGAVDGPAMHAETDDATRELVHDHEHPVAPEHDGLASKEVHAPQAVCRVSDERQPRGPGAARGGAIVFRQHAVHDVLVDVDPERVRDDARNPWTAEPRIARLELDDGLDECLARPLRSGLLRARARREQSAVLATHQRLMKRQKRRGAYGDGDLSDASWTEEERPESAEQPVAQRQVRRPLASTAQDDQLLLEQEILRDHRSHATGATQLRGHDGQVKQGEQEVLHARDSVGQTSGATQRCLNPGFSRELQFETHRCVLISRLARSVLGQVVSPRITNLPQFHV